MTIKIGKIVAIGNGLDGVRVEGDVHVEIGELHAANNGGQGLNIFKHAQLLEQFGLPKETDPSALAQILTQLQTVPPEHRPQAVIDSGLLTKIGGIAIDSTAFIANVVAIASNPAVVDIIKRLSGGI